MNSSNYITKIALIILIASLSLGVFACSKDGNDDQTTSAQTTSQTTDETTDAQTTADSDTQDIAKDSGWSKDYK